MVAALASASAASAQLTAIPFRSAPILRSTLVEPGLELGTARFALPIVEYRAPDGTWKRGQGIIIGRDIAPNATVGLGFFKIKPKHEDPSVPSPPSGGRSKKVSLGLSLRF